MVKKLRPYRRSNVSSDEKFRGSSWRILITSTPCSSNPNRRPAADAPSAAAVRIVVILTDVAGGKIDIDSCHSESGSCRKQSLDISEIFRDVSTSVDMTKTPEIG